MPCRKCNSENTLIWKDRAWTTAGEDPGHWSCMACGEVIYPGRGKSTVAETSKSAVGEVMSNHLDPEKEKEVESLLKNHSVREINAKTGVAKGTITRIRDKNFTEGEKAELKHQATVRGRHRRQSNNGDGGHAMVERTDKRKECTRKECKRHGQMLPFGDFHKNKSTPDGYEYWCKICKKESAKSRRKHKVSAGNGRKKGQGRDPKPSRVSLGSPRSRIDVVKHLFDEQLATDIKAIKKRVASEIIHLIQETFA